MSFISVKPKLNRNVLHLRQNLTQQKCPTSPSTLNTTGMSFFSITEKNPAARNRILYAVFSEARFTFYFRSRTSLHWQGDANLDLCTNNTGNLITTLSLQRVSTKKLVGRFRFLFQSCPRRFISARRHHSWPWQLDLFNSKWWFPSLNWKNDKMIIYATTSFLFAWTLKKEL